MQQNSATAILDFVHVQLHVCPVFVFNLRKPDSNKIGMLEEGYVVMKEG